MFKDVLDAVRAELANVAPLLDGRRHLGGNDVPPRYVWVRQTIAPAGGPGAIGGNPRSLGDDLHTGEVHCWGADEDDCERLRQALVTVIRRVLKGRNYDIGPAEISEQEFATHGAVLTFPVMVRLPLLEARLPVHPTAPAAVPPIADDTRTVAEVDAVGFDADGASQTDDVLEADEGW